jgi:hypothetical protein
MGVFFSAADWFAAPYVGGTQSAAIKAAMQFGLPVLASERIASDLPQDGYPLVLHPAGDASALAKDLRRVLEQGPAPAAPAARPGSDGWAELIRIRRCATHAGRTEFVDSPSELNFVADRQRVRMTSAATVPAPLRSP